MFSGTYISTRRAVQLELGSYNDRNDGYARTSHSRNKWNNAKIYKVNKISRTKYGYKAIINWIY